MLILLAGRQNAFSNKIYLFCMKYDFKTSKMTFLTNMSQKSIKEFSRNLFMFVRPIIDQTKAHFKILLKILLLQLA